MMLVILAVFFLTLVIWYFLYDPVRTKVKEGSCTCGKFDKCVSKKYIEHNSRGGRIYREPSEMWHCGKFQEKLNNMKNDYTP